MQSPNLRGEIPKEESNVIEDTQLFEERKREHIRLSLDPSNEAKGGNGLDRVHLIHEALPEINFEDINISQKTFGHLMATPFLISSMTAGYQDSLALNTRLAKACAQHGWLMGVGSQRRELNDESAREEWQTLRNEVPEARLMGNIGLSQLIQLKPEQIQKLVSSLDAIAMIIHLNPLQECVQMEGTPHFKNGIAAIDYMTHHLDVPVILKETGCGISLRTFKKISKLNLGAVDVSGYGGTHWGRIEGGRAKLSMDSDGDSTWARALNETGDAFANWGLSTVDSLLAGLEAQCPFDLWASGGVRTGIDAAKLLAMGSKVIGFAKPILEAALVSEKELDIKMSVLEYQLKTAMFCTGCVDIDSLKRVRPWKFQK